VSTKDRSSLELLASLDPRSCSDPRQKGVDLVGVRRNRLEEFEVCYAVKLLNQQLLPSNLTEPTLYTYNG